MKTNNETLWYDRANTCRASLKAVYNILTSVELLIVDRDELEEVIELAIDEIEETLEDLE